MICLLGILSSCSNRHRERVINEAVAENVIVEKIEIKTTHFNILTPYRIDCDEFENWADNLCSSYTINNKDTINLFIDIINALERDTIGHSIDVRGKVFVFYSNNQIDTLCINKYLISINGKNYINNKLLMELIEKGQVSN